jgi:hypothetical protein
MPVETLKICYRAPASACIPFMDKLNSIDVRILYVLYALLSIMLSLDNFLKSRRQ